MICCSRPRQPPPNSSQKTRASSRQIGMIGVLQTWGRNLIYHPHIHYVVPAGGLAKDGETWLSARQGFLLPVRALSRIFRGKMKAALRNTACYRRIPAKAWRQEWVVHCEEVGSGFGALKYLAPYIFRVAISNNRILKWKTIMLRFAIAILIRGQSDIAPCALKISFTVFLNMCFLKVL